MKVIFHISVALATFFLANASSHAQPANASAEVPPPRAPWVASPPERGAWQVVFANPSPVNPDAPEPQPPENQLLRIDADTWNAVKRDVFNYSDGTSGTIFYFAGMALVEGTSTKGQPTPVLVHQLPGTDFSNLRSQGWLAMEWLDGKYYLQPQPFVRTLTPPVPEPELCYVFRKPPEQFASGDSIPELTAWIRVSDMQPVALKIGDNLAEFQRLPDPSQPPPMTPEQAAKLLDLKDQNARMEKLRERNKRIRERREQLQQQNSQNP